LVYLNVDDGRLQTYPVPRDWALRNSRLRERSKGQRCIWRRPNAKKLARFENIFALSDDSPKRGIPHVKMNQ
jgi:hypothetical protein